MTLRIVTGSAAVVPSPTFTAADGYTPAATDAVPTVVATRSTGATVPTTTATVTDAPGVYTTTLAVADLADPDLLTLTWSGLVAGVVQAFAQEVQVVGGVYVPLIELWNLPQLPKDKMSSADVVALRDEFEDLAETYTSKAWVPRFAVDTVEVDIRSRYWCTGSIVLSHIRPSRILSAVTAANATAVSMTGWQLTSTGQIDFARLTEATVIRYVHGADRPPADLVQACRDFVRSKALERFGGNRIGRDVLSTSDGTGGQIRYSTPDWSAGRPTGLLDVDRVLNSLGTPMPGIA